jgi:hypothetical protein
MTTKKPLRVWYEIKGQELSIQILEQDEKDRHTLEFTAKNGYVIHSASTPVVTKQKLWIRGVMKQDDNKIRMTRLDDPLTVLRRMAEAICELNEIPVPEHLKPSGVIG